VAERDRLIDAIRTELGTSRSENVALRQEVAALKKALLDGRGITETPVLPPPGPIPVRAVTPSQQTVSLPITANLVAPNPHKDLPNSPRMGARGFWGGTGVGLGGLGGITPVHTAIIPEWSVLGALAGKPVLQENINPSLNGNGLGGTNVGGGAGFDSFAEVNPFTLKALDAYRMQLWGRMAAQQHAHNQSQNQNQNQNSTQQQQQQLSGLAGSLRPHYFTSSTRYSPTLGSLISGKAGANQLYPTPPASPKLSLSSSSSPLPSKEQQQHAMYAAMASQTLLKKLGSAFWEAFSGSSSPVQSSAAPAIAATGARGWDAEKVRKVLEGKAVVKIVDVEPSPSVVEGTVAAVGGGVDAGAAANARPPCVCALTDILEESMRSLSLGKKV
jgi:hypothetical protein